MITGHKQQTVLWPQRIKWTAISKQGLPQGDPMTATLLAWKTIYSIDSITLNLFPDRVRHSYDMIRWDLSIPTFQIMMVASPAPVTALSCWLLHVRAQILSSWASTVCTHSLVFRVHSLSSPSDPLQCITPLSYNKNSNIAKDIRFGDWMTRADYRQRYFLF